MTYNDQAEELRRMFSHEKPDIKKTKIISVTSGKGGVGKSNFILNFAIKLNNFNKKVVILDADIGLANIDVLMGIYPKNQLLSLTNPNKNIWDIIEKSPYGIEYIAGGTGYQDIISLNEADINRIILNINQLNTYADYLLIDTGAGINNYSLRFLLASDEIILVTTPEPTAVTDAYALIKIVYRKNPNAKIFVVINKAKSRDEGMHTANKLKSVVSKFLSYNLNILGIILDDLSVNKAVMQQVPFIIVYPQSNASSSIISITEKYIEQNFNEDNYRQLNGKSFLQRIVDLFK